MTEGHLTVDYEQDFAAVVPKSVPVRGQQKGLIPSGGRFGTSPNQQRSAKTFNEFRATAQEDMAGETYRQWTAAITASEP